MNSTNISINNSPTNTEYDYAKKLVIWGNRGIKLTATSIVLYTELKQKSITTETFLSGFGLAGLFHLLDNHVVPYLNQAITNNQEKITSKQEKVMQEQRRNNLGEFNSEAFDTLNKMPGLEEIKQFVKDTRKNIIYDAVLKANGMENKINNCYHMQLVGNSGTGKTEVAKLIATIFYDLGITRKDKVTFLDRSKLTSKWVNDTEGKTQKALKEAVGGIVIIDEAYTLNSGEGEGYQRDGGHQVIAQLLLFLEEYKDDVIVIFLGYEDKMDDLMKSSKGLSSRIRHKFIFPNYTESELLDIFKYYCDKSRYNISDEALKLVDNKLKQIKKNEGDYFGNARSVVNFYNKIISELKSRLVDDIEDLSNIKDVNELLKITDTDVEKTAINYVEPENEDYKLMYS